MPCARVLTIIAAMLIAAPSVLPAGPVKGGREYMKAKKELAQARREIRDYAELLAEMDALHLPRQMRGFWAVNTNIRSAMKHEYAQANKKTESDRSVEQAKPSGDVPQTARINEAPANYLEAVDDWRVEGDDEPDHLTAAELAAGMKAVILESEGLQRVMAAGEMDVMARYRHLLGEFLELMRNDVEAAAEALER